MADRYACPTCALEIVPGLTYCPRCRAQGEGRPFEPDAVDRHERAYVVSLVVVSLGALATPRLWRSPAFGTGAKLGLTLVGALNTGGVVLVLWWFTQRWLPALLQAAR